MSNLGMGSEFKNSSNNDAEASGTSRNNNDIHNINSSFKSMQAGKSKRKALREIMEKEIAKSIEFKIQQAHNPSKRDLFKKNA